MQKNKVRYFFIVFLVANVFSLQIFGETNAEITSFNKSRLAGTYNVPVQEETLRPFSTFPIRVKLRSNDKHSTLNYELPMEISGRNIELEFQIETSEFGYRLTGPLGIGECNKKFSQVICKMEYNKDLNINLNEVNQYLKSTGSIPNELEQRQTVAQLFSVDPIGILSFEMK